MPWVITGPPNEATRHPMLSTTALAIVLFASTNLDDVFVLLAFYADGRFRSG